MLRNSQINLSEEEQLANAQVILGDYGNKSPASREANTAEQSNGKPSLGEKLSVVPPQVEDIVT